MVIIREAITSDSAELKQLYILAIKNSKVVGTIWLGINFNSVLGKMNYGSLENVVVDPTCRREGIAELLIIEDIEECKKYKCNKVIAQGLIPHQVHK